ncbi:hypothetical protein C3F09_04325 [candidate division GN15 bacterium]|uniref:Uncharacterized protein n=1 Tax=candidate division GN15 bacterium TaxID=2072418 RepID=A0A855X4V8_9BACT|nr:MAG: hypothetical protein C3F09_04325 [candidate division GN15 bacterium]
MVAKLTSLFQRLFFVVAAILVILAALDWFIGFFGWTFEWLPYQPGRLFEFAAILIIFVIATLLRQIRDSLRK